MTKTEKRLKELQEEQQHLFEKLEQEKANKKFDCCWCKKQHKIKDCEVIQTHYYTNEPYAEGWLESDLHIVCPTTGKRNRVLFQARYDIEWPKRNDPKYDLSEKFSSEYKRLFKKVIDEHKDNCFSGGTLLGIDFKNNEYFDKNCEKFGFKREK
jgi:hypothetical protein